MNFRDELQMFPGDPRYSQSLERGLAILSSFTSERPLRGIADLSEELGMSRSTTHRYAITLAALGFLEQGANRKYRLGLRVLDLGMSALNSTGLREHARPYLEELRKRSGNTVGLAVLDGLEAVYVDRARGLRIGLHRSDMGIRVGSRLPAPCMAAGKVLLAYLPAYEQRKLMGMAYFVRHGPNTIMSERMLRSELERVCEDGFAVDDEELMDGLVGLAVPVRDESNEVIAALDITAHTSVISLEQLVDEFSPHLLVTADSLAARLGYRRTGRRPER